MTAKLPAGWKVETYRSARSRDREERQAYAILIPGEDSYVSACKYHGAAAAQKAGEERAVRLSGAAGVSRSGGVLSEADLEGYAAEADHGYALPGMWEDADFTGGLTDMPVPGPSGCQVCGHHDPHRPHPDGEGWPSTVLKCASCPDGTCALPKTSERN